MELSSVRIAAGACAVLGGLALASGGAVANAAPDAHGSAASGSGSDSGAGATNPSTASSHSGVGKAASGGGGGSAASNAHSKFGQDVSARVRAALDAATNGAIPNPAGAIPNPAGAVPNPAGAVSGTTSSTAAPSTAATSTPGGGTVGVRGYGQAGMNPVGRVIDGTWQVVSAVENFIGSIAGGSIPVDHTPAGQPSTGNGSAPRIFLSSSHNSIATPPASVLSGRHLPLTLNLGSYPVPEVSATGFSAPLPDAFLTPELAAAVDSANVATPPVISTIPMPSTKWLTDLPSQVRTALQNASTLDLFMGALPGLMGLISFFAAGIGLGRRQAKFGFAMENTGIMRFAAKGPLGVVRPGGFIAIHGKAAPVGQRRSVARLTLVDRVA
jgi:hypothetical protein